MLDRPIRVCGMVRNEGEPGGGPFWTLDEHGMTSPQIVEGSQVDTRDSGQQAILRGATHFNPVDLVCGVRDADGGPYDLARFVDPRAVFISSQVPPGPAAAGARATGPLERRHGPLEHRVRRGTRRHLRPGQDGLRPPPP